MVFFPRRKFLWPLICSMINQQHLCFIAIKISCWKRRTAKCTEQLQVQFMICWTNRIMKSLISIHAVGDSFEMNWQLRCHELAFCHALLQATWIEFPLKCTEGAIHEPQGSIHEIADFNSCRRQFIEFALQTHYRIGKQFRCHAFSDILAYARAIYFHFVQTRYNSALLRCDMI